MGFRKYVGTKYTYPGPETNLQKLALPKYH